MSTMMDCSLASRMASKRLRRHRLNRDATGELFLRPPSKIRGFVQAQAAPGPVKVLAPCINQERSESVDKVAAKRKASHELFLAPDGTKRTPQEIDAAFARLVSNSGLVAETANRLLAMYNEDEDMRRRYSLLICMDYYLMPCRRAYYMGFCDGPAATGQCELHVMRLKYESCALRTVVSHCHVCNVGVLEVCLTACATPFSRAGHSVELDEKGRSRL
jgi:hypothetical protein